MSAHLSYAHCVKVVEFDEIGVLHARATALIDAAQNRIVTLATTVTMSDPRL